jgi:hypothetical protein
MEGGTFEPPGGSMNSDSGSAINQFVDESIETAEARFRTLEKDAKKVLKVVKSRRRAGEARVEKLLGTLAPARLGKRFRKAERQWSKAFGQLVDELTQVLATIQSRLLGTLGVATSVELEALADQVEKLSRKVDRFARAQPKASAAAAQPAKVKLVNGLS